MNELKKRTRFKNASIVASIGYQKREIAFSACLFMGFVILATAFPQYGNARQSTIDRIDWHVEKDLDESSLLAVSVAWSDAPLGARLAEFARRQKIAVFVDRRVDPTTKIRLGVNNVTWEQFLSELTTKYKLSSCRLGDVYYVGPDDWAIRLASRVNDLGISIKKNKKHVKALKRRREMSWDRLDSPLEIVKKAAKKDKIRFEGPIDIPHDLWSESAFPSLPMPTRMSLLLVGFEKSFEVQSDGRLRIVPFPLAKTGHMKFENLDGASGVLEEVKSAFPNMELTSQSRAIVADGTISDLQRFSQQIYRHQKAVHGVGTLSINTTASRGDIISSVAALSGRRLKFAPEIGKALVERISIKLIDQTPEAIVGEALKGTGLRFEMTAEKIVVTK